MVNSWIMLSLSFLACMMIVIAIEQPPDSMEAVDGKPDEIARNKRPSFFVGSRYGRSYYGNSKSTRVNVAPRNDRFFLGSRYGKRNSDYLSGLESEGHEPSSEWSSSNRSKLFTMSCVHTGFKNFFRCNSLNDINNYIQQRLTNDEHE